MKIEIVEDPRRRDHSARQQAEQALARSKPLARILAELPRDQPTPAELNFTIRPNELEGSAWFPTAGVGRDFVAEPDRAMGRSGGDALLLGATVGRPGGEVIATASHTGTLPAKWGNNSRLNLRPDPSTAPVGHVENYRSFCYGVDKATTGGGLLNDDDHRVFIRVD